MGDTNLELEPFDPATSSEPEAAAAVWAVVSVETDDGLHFVSHADITKRPDAAEVLKKDAAWSRRCLLAMCDVAEHLGVQRDRVAGQATKDYQRWNPQMLPGGQRLLQQIRSMDALATALLRRKLPLELSDLLRLLTAATGSENERMLVPFRDPQVWILKRLDDAAESMAGDEELADAVRKWRPQVAKTYDAKKLLPRVDALLAKLGEDGVEDATDIVLPAASPPKVAAGSPERLVELKQQLGLREDDAVDAEATGLDAFPLRTDSPLLEKHRSISEASITWCEATASLTAAHHTPMAARWTSETNPEAIEDRRAFVVDQLVARHDSHRLSQAVQERLAVLHSSVAEGADFNEPGYFIGQALQAFERAVPLDNATLERDIFFDDLLSVFARGLYAYQDGKLEVAMLDQVEAFAREQPLSDGEKQVLWRAVCNVLQHPPAGTIDPVISRAMRLIFGANTTLLLVPGEYWSDAVHGDLARASEKQRAAWVGLLKHASSAEASRPTAKWKKEAAACVRSIRPSRFRDQLAPWFIAVAKGRSIPIRRPYMGGSAGSDFVVNDGNATVLKGLVWSLAGHADAKTPRVVADLLLTSLKKVPGIGPRCVKLANACVWALGELAKDKRQDVRDAALAQLARLKARVTFRTTLKAIEKVLDAAAEKAGMSKDALEELGTPTLGFEKDERREVLGGAEVVLRLDRNKVTTSWTNDKSKAVKSPPAAVRRDYKDDLKELKQAAKDAEGVVAAAKSRLDKLYLDDRSWTLADWRERYLDHGLVGTLTHRLIWSVDETPVLFDGSVATDVRGDEVTFGETAEVRLWHPIASPTDQVIAWRERLAALSITQPFKQAHREVYVLTDAERNTNTYSNRFAGHVLKQHQYNALCALRGWRNQLRLLVDDTYPPTTRDLPVHGLRAEYWVEGVGDDFGADTNESGVYLYLATDQVRFYRTGAGVNYQHAAGGAYEMHGHDDIPENYPVPLEEIPPLVLSEVLRDCDLFVGVTSVGNDPTWQDGGREGGFATYWHDFSFGDLGQTAQTRKAVLEKLVPRLKIADRCSFSDKFLVVRGEVRTYKIHLGSGNILMEPNDQYLCIVPDRRAESATEKSYLPFEGDRTMSVIVSKALLLADDTKITDSTILSQIR